MSFDFVAELKMLAINFRNDKNGRRLASRFVEEMAKEGAQHPEDEGWATERLLEIQKAAKIRSDHPIIMFMVIAVNDPRGISALEEEPPDTKEFDQLIKKLEKSARRGYFS